MARNRKKINAKFYVPAKEFKPSLLKKQKSANTLRRVFFGELAQWIEQRFSKPSVAGSSPAFPASRVKAH